MANPRRTFTDDFKQFFGRGLAILLPSVLTLWILWSAGVFVFNKVAVPINAGIRGVIVWASPRIWEEDKLPVILRVTPEQLVDYRRQQTALGRGPIADHVLRAELRRNNFRDFWEAQWYLAATGLIVAIVLIYFAGLLLGGIFGRKIYGRLERLIARIPGFKQVYPHVKQVVNLVIGDKPLAFKRVVLVEYPRKGIWTLGMVTSSSLRAVKAAAGNDALSVFIPSTPAPFTGFTINVPARDVIDLPLSIDEAVRFILTGGVLIPESQANAPMEAAVQALANRIAAGSPGPTRE
jgi:uncharacterized membrane protein